MTKPSYPRRGALFTALLLCGMLAQPALALNWGWDQDHTLYTFIRHFLGMDDQDKAFQGKGDGNYSLPSKKTNPEEPQADPDPAVKQKNPGCDDKTTACPFLLKSGKIQRADQDIALPGVGPVISIFRVYNGTDPENGLLGLSWRFNLGKSIVRVKNTGDEEFVLVKDQGGQKYRLKKSGSGYTTPAGYIKPRFTLEDAGPGWKLSEQDGTVVLFDGMGNATSITDPQGLAATITYDPASGCPREAKNASGNTLTFAIGPNGKIASVKDNLGRSVTYTYDAAANLLSAGYWDKTQTAYAYDSAGQMTSVTDRSGRVEWSVAYAADGRVSQYTEKGMTYTVGYGAGFVTETDSKGDTKQIFFNEQGVRTKLNLDGVVVEERLPNPVKADAADWVQDGLNHRTLITRDANGNKTKQTDALGHAKTWTYDGAGRVTGSVDENGVASSYAYDSKGNLVSSRIAAGTPQEAAMAYTYDGSGNILTSTDANGHTRSYAYDGDGKRTKQTDPDGSMRSWTYDSLGFPASYKDPLSAVWTFHFDAVGNRLSEVTPLGDSTAWTYDPTGHVLSERDPLGRVTRFGYDAFGRLATVLRPQRDTTFYRYDHLDQLTYVRKSGSRPILFQYNTQQLRTAMIVKMGDTLATADTSDLVTSYTYDNAGNLLTLTLPNGGRETYAYDALNRLTKRTNALSEVTSYAYDNLSNDTLITLLTGRLLRKKYDALGRPVEASDNLGLLARIQYDPMGNLLRSEAPGAASALNTFDALDRLASSTDSSGAGSGFTYDAAGRLIESRDTLGNITRTGYDAVGRKIWQRNALGDTVHFEYDASDNLTALTDAEGNRTLFTYDSLSRVVKTVYPTGLTESTEYDLAGRIAARTDGRGIVATFAYDDAGRLIGKTYSDTTPAATFVYDKLGNLLAANNAAATETWTRDLAGKPLTFTQTMAAKALTLKYAYGTAARTVATTYPDNSVITRFYDHRERLDSIRQATQLLVKYAYAQGFLTKKTLGNGVIGTYGFDRDARLANLKYMKVDTTLFSMGMGYDPVGRKTSRTNLANANGSETFGYDKTDQLTLYKRGAIDGSLGIPSPVEERDWTFDTRGNWTANTVNGVTEARTFNGLNELTQLGAAPFQYDAAGNLIQDTARTYGWDAESRLIAANTATYLYDALGRRVGTRSGATGVNYVFDGDREVYDDTLGGGTASVVHGNFIDEVISVKTNTLLWFALTDESFNILEWRTAAGAVQGPIRYTPFGEPVYGVGGGGLVAAELPAGMFGFQGKRWDYGAGAWYSRARLYNPSYGRFLSTDALRYGALDVNLYRFVSNNPVAFTDPSGNNPVLLAILLIDAGLTLYDAYQFAKDLSDPCATNKDKASSAFSLSLDFFGGAIVKGGIKVGKVIYQRSREALEAVRIGIKEAQAASKISIEAVSQALKNPGAAGTTVAEGTKVYRVWGDEAGAMGRSWTTVDPRTVPDYRNAAGLPVQNSGRFVSEGVLQNAQGVTTREALPLHGNSGGLPEVVVPNPESQILLQNVQGLNPEF